MKLQWFFMCKWVKNDDAIQGFKVLNESRNEAKNGCHIQTSKDWS